MSRGYDNKRKSGVKLEDVVFYFDSVERDRLDSSGTSRKSGEVLALRDRLVRLPDEQFEAAIKTLKSLVSSGAEDSGSDDAEGRRRRGETLYDSTRSRRGGGTGSTGKVSPT